MNKIDKKWKQAVEFPTKTQLYLAHKTLIKYMKSFTSPEIKKAVLDKRPYLYYLYGNLDNSAVLFRGMYFSDEKQQIYYKLLKQVVSNRFLDSNSISSWTLDPSTAYDFAYYFYRSGHKFLLENNKYKRSSSGTVTSAVVLTAAFNEGEGLDLIDNSKLKEKFRVNEYEVIMPPGSIECIVESAAFISPDNTIYVYYSRYGYESDHNELEKSINKAIEKNNKSLDRYIREPEYNLQRVSSIQEYLRLYVRDML